MSAIEDRWETASPPVLKALECLDCEEASAELMVVALLFGRREKREFRLTDDGLS
jgi:hypothetical protein